MNAGYIGTRLDELDLSGTQGGERSADMIESIRRCPHCKQESIADAREWTENPYCHECVEERLAAAASLAPPFRWVAEGNYSRLIQEPRKPVGDGPTPVAA